VRSEASSALIGTILARELNSHFDARQQEQRYEDMFDWMLSWADTKRDPCFQPPSPSAKSYVFSQLHCLMLVGAKICIPASIGRSRLY